MDVWYIAMQQTCPVEFAEDARVLGNESRDNLRYGLHFMFSHRCEYRDNRFLDNGAGVAVMYTRNMLMQGNTFADNWGAASYGLLLKEIRDRQHLPREHRRDVPRGLGTERGHG